MRINLKSTSPEGIVKTFKSIREAAGELGFSERGVGKAFHAKRNRIGDYELEWLEPEEETEPQSKPEPKTKLEKIKEDKSIDCWICGKPLGPKDRMDDRCLEIEELNSEGKEIESHFPGMLYKASKISGLSLHALRNARDKGNRLLVRRKDKKPFRLSWCTSHDLCFEARRERIRLEEMREIEERAAKRKEK